MFYTANYDSHLGRLLLISDGINLTELRLETQKAYTPSVFSELKEKEDLPVFHQTRQWFDAYFQGANPHISSLPLAPRGSKFQQMVWHILCQIPYGEVLTYGNIAKLIALKIGKSSMSAQAVGQAVGRNPIPIIIPCHRVIGIKGNLTGYSGGLDTKIKLLKIENIDISQFVFPKKKKN